MRIQFSAVAVAVVLLAASTLLCDGQTDSVNPDILLKNVDRVVDLASQVVKIGSKITLENAGKSPVKSFLFALDPSTVDHLAHISAVIPGSSSNDDGKKYLQVTPTKINEHKGKTLFRIDLRQPLDAGKTIVVEVETMFTQLLSPYPLQITQAERQQVLYHGNHYLYSPYTATKQTTNVILTSGGLESYTKLKPVSHSDGTITYGPYEKVQSFSVNEMIVHYENNSPFLTITELERFIEVSHWGNIAVEESVDLKHTGATLKGPFSRYEYQREQNGASSIKSFKTVLPAASSDVYYRDEIGNISTSHLRILDDAVEVDLRPRFPLFGGWKTHYLIGYNLPSYEYLYHEDDHYVLKMRFIDHIFDDMVVEHATVKIVLPEGAKDIRLKAPYEVKRSPNSLHYTYLDTTGRPVVIAHKQNLVENHIQDFELHYTYQKILMFQEPLLVVLAFYLLFLVVIVYVRLDFSMTKDEVSESKMRVAGLCEQVQSHQDRRANIYQQYDSALNQFKSSKDAAAFQSVQKKLAADHKCETQAITDIAAKLKQEANDSAEKVSELQKLDRQLKEQITLQITSTEKLIGGRMKKDQFVESEQSLNKKKEEIREKIESILASL